MTILAGAVLLLVLVFIHELGHFVVAKLAGVRVLTFSLGFGPRLFGVKVGDTDYRVSLFPLGGYVRMYGDDIHEEVPPEEKHRSYLHKPVLQKAAIAFAGPAANFLLPVVVFFVAAVGVETVPTATVGTVLPGEAADRAGLVSGDRIVSANGQEVETFQDLHGLIRSHPGQKVELVVERGGERVSLVVVPQARESQNPLEKGEVFGHIGVAPAKALPALTVAPTSAAAAAGLQAGDRVVSVNGQPVATAAELLQALDAASPDAAWTLEVKSAAAPGANAGGSPAVPEVRTVEVPVPATPLVVDVTADVKRYAVTRDELTPALRRTLETTSALAEDHARALARRRGIDLYEATVAKVADKTSAAALGLETGDRVLAVDGRALTMAFALQQELDEDPEGPHVISVLRTGEEGPAIETMVFRQGRSAERGLKDLRVFGAVLGSAYGDAETVEREVGVGSALLRAVKETGDMIALTAKGLWMLVTFQASLDSLGGPITIFNLAGDAMEGGFGKFVFLLCFISVNLGLINLLPVPVLDGGHLLLFAIEAVRRKELDLATKERALKAGLTMLVLLMGVAIFNDLVQLFS